MTYQRPYQETKPRTAENVAEAERIAEEKARAIGKPYLARHRKRDEAVVAQAAPPVLEETVKPEDEQPAETNEPETT